MTRSKIFEKIGISDIGRQLDSSDESPFLKIRLTFETFKSSGKTPSLIERRKTWNKGFLILSITCKTTLLFRSSYPAALLDFKEEIDVSNSP